MKTAIQQWGNSLALRIPRHLANESQVKLGSPVEVTIADGKLVVVPVSKRRTYTLSQLLKKVTKRNLHKEVPAGSRVGREAW
jgi:antitoxin MazE